MNLPHLELFSSIYRVLEQLREKDHDFPVIEKEKAEAVLERAGIIKFSDGSWQPTEKGKALGILTVEYHRLSNERLQYDAEFPGTCIDYFHWYPCEFEDVETYCDFHSILSNFCVYPQSHLESIGQLLTSPASESESIIDSCRESGNGLDACPELPLPALRYRDYQCLYSSCQMSEYHGKDFSVPCWSFEVRTWTRDFIKQDEDYRIWTLEADENRELAEKIDGSYWYRLDWSEEQEEERDDILSGFPSNLTNYYYHEYSASTFTYLGQLVHDLAVQEDMSIRDSIIDDIACFVRDQLSKDLENLHLKEGDVITAAPSRTRLGTLRNTLLAQVIANEVSETVKGVIYLDCLFNRDHEYQDGNGKEDYTDQDISVPINTYYLNERTHKNGSIVVVDGVSNAHIVQSCIDSLMKVDGTGDLAQHLVYLAFVRPFDNESAEDDTTGNANEELLLEELDDVPI